MITNRGQVMITPKAGLGMDDFQRLYMGEGRTPQEAASFIHLNYPMEVKSKMESEWRKMGINDSPERYFSNPANLRILNGGTNEAIMRTNTMMGPRAVHQVANQALPQFNAAGMMPGMGGNVAKLAALQMMQQEEQAGQILEAAPAAYIRNIQDKAIPMPMSDMDDAGLKRAQSAGDTTGFIRKFLAQQSGIKNYDEWLSKPMAQDPNSLALEKDNYRRETDIMPYRPDNLGVFAQGMGRLDHNIYNDKGFQDLLARDQEQAAYVYRRLTGRDLKGDYDETMKQRKETYDTGRRYAQKAIEEGAQFDPVRRQWMVWNVAEAPDNSNPLMQGAPRPFRQRVRATDEQSAWLNQHYSTIIGRPLGSAPTFGTKEATDILRRAQKDPNGELAQKIKADRERVGSELTSMEIIKIAHDLDVAKIASSRPENDGFFPQVRRGIERGFRALTGQGDDEVIERGNSPLVDFANEYFGTEIGNRTVDEIKNGKRTGRRIVVPWSPEPSKPVQYKPMMVNDIDPITGQMIQRRMLIDPITGTIKR